MGKKRRGDANAGDLGTCAHRKDAESSSRCGVVTQEKRARALCPFFWGRAQPLVCCSRNPQGGGFLCNIQSCCVAWRSSAPWLRSTVAALRVQPGAAGGCPALLFFFFCFYPIAGLQKLISWPCPLASSPVSVLGIPLLAASCPGQAVTVRPHPSTSFFSCPLSSTPPSW